jgi:tetratricopeptide (TPR) repeat protein
LHSNNKIGREALERGVEAHRAGRFEEALTEYRAALSAAPGDAETASLTGLALVHCGRPEEALPFLNQAVVSEPDQMGFRFNLAEGLIAAGDAAQAEAQLRIVLARHPESPQAWERIGDVAMLRRDTDAAASAWRLAFDRGPGLSSGLKLARHELSRSRVAAAEAIVECLTARFPDEITVRALRCDCLMARRDWAGLERVAVAWTRADPGRREAWRALAHSAFEVGRYRDAVMAFSRVLDPHAGSADDLAAYAGLQLHALDFEAAAATLDRAAKLSPHHPGLLAQRATLHMYFGRFDAALDCCRRCLAQDPENVPAYAILGRVSHGRLAPGEIAVLERIAGPANASLDARLPAAFTLAHAHDACGDIDAAFAAYEYAQSLAIERDRQEGRSYDRAESEARFERLARLLTSGPPLPAQAPAGPRPIFIVGMPRSGTTLVECVLGAHSRVHACGERTSMRQILRAALELAAGGRTPHEMTLRNWAAASLRELPGLRGADHFTDKHPLNFEAIGLIARLFPGAAIVHVRRDPVETCLSVFRQEIGKLWTFARRLEDVGHYYGLYARLMAHWQQQLPGRIMTVQYEEFAGDFNVGASRLVESIGLPWEPRCLDFQQIERAIATFSTIEARGPVSVRNRRARAYSHHLAPLIRVLAAGGVDLTTGALTGEGRMDDPAAR